MEQETFKSLKIERNSKRMTINGNGNKSVELRHDGSKWRIGGQSAGNMPQTLADIEALSTFWSDVYNYLDGIL